MRSLYQQITAGVCAALMLWSCTRPINLSVADTAEAQTSDMVSDADCTPQAWEYADSLMTQMTTEQMAAQLLMPASYANCDAATMKRLLFYIEDMQVGGVVFHKGDTASMRLISRTLQSHSRIPPIIAIDAENGLGMRLKGADVYPLNYMLSDYSESSMYDYGYKVGEECMSVGINMVFGPVLDVVPGPGWYMYKRSLGSDPVQVADKGVAYACGMRDAGVMPVGKHFPGLGYTHTDPHVWLPIIDRAVKEFRDIDLLPFCKYISQGMPALMAAHVAIPSFTGDSLPADFSAEIMTELLRGEIGFKGLIISDAVNMGAVKAMKKNSASLSVMALVAGVDIILAPDDTRAALKEILKAVDTGELPLSVLREHCRRVLFYKYLYLN